MAKVRTLAMWGWETEGGKNEGGKAGERRMNKE
jgi:hypothetical protein